jgi:dimethylhistidine N-methyltransferase
MLDVQRNRIGQFEALSADVVDGLAQQQKTLPSRWLYDDLGCELFEEITKLEEYYPTRMETAILHAHAGEIADFCGENVLLLEYGVGAGVKTEILVDALRSPRFYIPIDIAGDFLDQTVARFRRRFPNIPAKPIVSDFTAPFLLPAWIAAGRCLAFFPGSTIGNLSAGEVAVFLRRLRCQVGAEGRAIIGVDMKKELQTLISAYDDSAGVTARFNLNLLTRLNRELNGNFVLDRFLHSARWNEAESAVEMHLVSLCAQTVKVRGNTFHFDTGETIHTESSRKYDVPGFVALADRNGWRTDRIWTDERGYFTVFGLG